MVHFIRGTGFSVLVIVGIALLFVSIQSADKPVQNLFDFLVSTNADMEKIDPRNINITAGGKALTFKFSFSGAHDGLLIQPFFTEGFRIRSGKDGGTEPERYIKNNWMLLDLSGDEGDHTVIVEIEKDGQLVLKSPPFVGDYDYLEFFSGFTNLFSNQFVMIIAGMSLLLSFIMFSISRVNKNLSRSYLALGISLLYYGVLFLLTGTFLKESSLLYSMLPDTNPEIKFLYIAFSLLSLIFTVVLFYGVEYYLFKDWRYTKILAAINLPVFAFVLLGIPYIVTVVGFINFIFFAIIAYKSGLSLFAFLAFIRPLGEITNLFSESIYPLYSFNTNEITFFIVFVGFGGFFIMDYNRQQKEINSKNEELSASNEEITAMNQELESSYMEIEKLNADLEMTVLKRTEQLRKSMSSIQTLLNNTDEGFLKFDNSLLIEPEYSRKCEAFFGKRIDFNFFPALLFSQEPDQIPFLTDILRGIFSEGSPEKTDILISLLPEKIIRESRTLALDYRVIFEESASRDVPDTPAFDEEGLKDYEKRKKIMVIIRDISEKLALQNKLEREKELFEKIVKLMANSEDFFELRDDYYIFWKRIETQWPSMKRETQETYSEWIKEVYRQIHTFKGNFASFGFKHVVKRLHELETTLSASDRPEIKEHVIRNREYASWLEEEMKSVYDYISPEIFNKQIEINEKKKSLKRIRRLLEGSPDEEMLQEARSLLSDIEQTTFGELFESTKDLVLTTANRLNKALKTIEVSGSDVIVDRMRLKPLAKNWIHLFRNILDHAVEEPEKRVRKGKDPYLSITVSARRNRNGLVIEIADDGAGIDQDRIFERAIQKGFVDESDIEKGRLTLEDILFMEAFSTKDRPTEISGRGVGLSAVKRAVDEISGEITVSSEKDRGTVFRITVPE